MSAQSKPWHDPEVLKQMYWDEEMTQSEIADKLGCSTQTVRNHMQRHSIDTRKGARAKVDTLNNFVPLNHGLNGGHVAWDMCNERDGSVIVYVHQLLAISEGVEPEKVFSQEFHIHHKNGIPWDNRPENIENLSAQKHSNEHVTEKREYNDEELLSWLQAYVGEFDEVPLTEVTQNWPGPSYNTYVRRFGSWNKAIKEAGFTPRSDNE